MQGIYAMLTNDTTRDARLCATPGVAGALVQLVWSRIEPQPGVFDFTDLDAQLAAAGPSLQLAIGMGAGFGVPPWLAARRGVQSVTLDLSPSPGGTAAPFAFPLPWCPAVIDANLAVQQAIHNHLSADTLARVTAVRAQVGWESQLAVERAVPDFDFGLPTGGQSAMAQAWADAGYRPTVVREAWLAALDELAVMWSDQVLQVCPFQNGDAFPWVDDTGALLADTATQDVTMAHLTAACLDFPGEIQVIDVSFSNVPQRSLYPRSVAAGCLQGYQPNTFGPDGEALTGTWADKGYGGAPALRDILANAAALAAPRVPYVELHPSNFAYPDVITAAAESWH